MNKDKVFIWHSDPGHAWLAVKRKLLIDLGILHKITPYSYQKGKTVYLEEDCDGETFYLAWIAKYGAKPVTKSTVYENRAPCYYYEPFKLEEHEDCYSCLTNSI